MELPTLREYCEILAQTITAELLEHEGKLSGDELEKIVKDLEIELSKAYADNGSPYGTEEADMVKYLLENTQISIEEEDF